VQIIKNKLISCRASFYSSCPVHTPYSYQAQPPQYYTSYKSANISYSTAYTIYYISSTLFVSMVEYVNF